MIRVVLAVLLTLIVVEGVSARRGQQDVLVRDSLDELGIHVARVDALTLASNARLVGNHDALVTSFDRLLSAAAQCLPQVAAADVAVDHVTQVLQRRARDTEELKTRRGALTNIERHLFRLIDDLERGLPAETDRSRLRHLKDALLAYLLSPDTATIDELDRARQTIAPGTVDRLARLAPHLTGLLDARRHLDVAGRAILAFELSSDVAHLKLAFERSCAQRRVHERNLRLLLVALACVGLGGTTVYRRFSRDSRSRR